MAIEYIKRGEIYGIKVNDAVGSEQSFVRPGLVISSNEGNNSSPLVIIAYMTTKDHNIGIHYGPTKATGIPSYVQCEQIYTVSKTRLTRLMGMLSKNEMKEVDDRLDEVFDLGWEDDTLVKEKEQECSILRIQIADLKAEIAELKKKDAAHADELLNRDIEIAVAKRMYEKAVGIIAAMRVKSDLPVKPKVAKVEPPKPKEEKAPTAEAEVAELVDINTAKFDDLKKVGFSDNLAANVIQYRPYKKIEDIKKRCGVSAAKFGIVKKRICCVPVKMEAEPKVEKINVNTASVMEIKNGTGMGINPAYSIIGYRKTHGTIKSLDELAGLKYWTKSLVEKHREKLEV